ncbi:MAG: 4-(cytidine 5'-diphospho)-2-C-methyl-D-erythritol kinase [Oscillospiraceae bacterium]|nr:4-(cytidine 5'-diphospho)-2-C-methyl-D-erythritol kinase [Oscillospiraceae bacterium]
MEHFRKATEAYAKVNLLLRIVGLREDGYHLLSTVMQPVSLSDTVEIDIDFSGTITGRSPDIRLAPDDTGIPSDSRNTMYRAADAYLSRIGKPSVQVRITADKQIPVKAGLGGGSSDAAAVLRLLNEGFSGALSGKELIDVALSVGADVPFFIDGRASLCEGIGERITPVRAFAGLPVLIIKPGKGVSTPEAYAIYDSEARTFSSGVREESGLMAALTAEDEGAASRLRTISPYLFNDLTGAAVKAVPEIARVSEFFEKSGSIYSAVSGSGSAVFGIFDDQKLRYKAGRDAGAFFGSGSVVFSCETIG